MNLPFKGAWYQKSTVDVNDQIHIINIFDFLNIFEFVHELCFTKIDSLT